MHYAPRDCNRVCVGGGRLQRQDEGTFTALTETLLMTGRPSLVITNPPMSADLLFGGFMDCGLR